MKTILICLFMALAQACSSVSLSPAGRKVVVIFQARDGCENLGLVTGEDGHTFGQYLPSSILIQSAVADATNKAARLGAAHLQIQPPSVVNARGDKNAATVMGIAFRCPGGAAAPADAEVVPAP